MRVGCSATKAQSWFTRSGAQLEYECALINAMSWFTRAGAQLEDDLQYYILGDALQASNPNATPEHPTAFSPSSSP